MRKIYFNRVIKAGDEDTEKLLSILYDLNDTAESHKGDVCEFAFRDILKMIHNYTRKMLKFNDIFAFVKTTDDEVVLMLPDEDRSCDIGKFFEISVKDGVLYYEVED